jgi:S-adenosylhomocysteine hydrolase
VVLGFSWLGEGVMTKSKEEGMRLIVVKVEIVGIW